MSQCDWTIRSHRKAAANKKVSFDLSAKSHQKKIPELENLGSLQSSLDAFQNGSPLLQERGREWDCVAPWAHWQNNIRIHLFQKEHKYEQEGPPDLKRELQTGARGKGVVGLATYLQYLPTSFAGSSSNSIFAKPTVPRVDLERPNETGQTIYFMTTNDISHWKAQKFPHAGHCVSLALSYLFLCFLNFHGDWNRLNLHELYLLISK